MSGQLGSVTAFLQARPLGFIDRISKSLKISQEMRDNYLDHFYGLQDFAKPWWCKDGQQIRSADNGFLALDNVTVGFGQNISLYFINFVLNKNNNYIQVLFY
jgi:hypothetical protein